MPTTNGRHPGADDEGEDRELDAEYDAMLELDRLETLEEDMIELGVHTLDEVRQRIADLHRQLDEEA